MRACALRRGDPRVRLAQLLAAGEGAAHGLFLVHRQGEGERVVRQHLHRRVQGAVEQLVEAAQGGLAAHLGLAPAPAASRRARRGRGARRPAWPCRARPAARPREGSRPAGEGWCGTAPRRGRSARSPGRRVCTSAASWRVAAPSAWPCRSRRVRRSRWFSRMAGWYSGWAMRSLVSCASGSRASTSVGKRSLPVISFSAPYAGLMKSPMFIPPRISE